MTEENKIVYKDFQEYFSKNADLDNKEYYEAFPDVPMSTIRYWKSKAINKSLDREIGIDIDLEEDKEEKPKEHPHLVELVKMKKQAAHLTLNESEMLEMNDLATQNKMLDIILEKRKSRPGANRGSLPTPVGVGESKYGIDRYMKIDPDKHEIHMEIPFSVLMDPEKNKKLGEKI